MHSSRITSYNVFYTKLLRRELRSLVYDAVSRARGGRLALNLPNLAPTGPATAEGAASPDG